jgi:nucleotide-binding universal stress UspA family protein
MKQFNRILLATDFTPASALAIEKAIAIAKESGARLLIAHAYDPPNLTQAESVGPGVYEEWDQNLRTLVERKLQPLVESARRQLVDAQPLVLPGSPHEAIVEAAKQNHSDLVVMGTHGRTGVSRFFLGSVAARVIATAPCPVMTVRANLEAAARRPHIRPVRSHAAGPRRLRAAIEEDR